MDIKKIFMKKKVLLLLIILIFSILAVMFFWRAELLQILRREGGVPHCGDPKLAIGTSVYRIEESADLFPVGGEETAFLMNSVENRYIFTLGPSIKNLDLVRSLKPGEIATITWADCHGLSFNLQAPGLEKGFRQDEFDWMKNDFILLASEPSSDDVYLVRGDVIKMEVIQTDVPSLDTDGLAAEITLSDVDLDEKKEIIQITISIRNMGKSYLEISPEDIFLISPDQTMIKPAEFKPPLPFSLAEGEKLKLKIVFKNTPPAMYELGVFSSGFLLE